MGVDVGRKAVLGVDEVGIGCEGVVDVGHQRQLLPLDLDGGGAGLGRLGRLGDDEGEMVGLPSADVARHRRAAGVLDADEHRLVEQREAVLVHGHVGGGEHRDHAIDRLGGRGVEANHSCVGLVGEHDLGHQRVGRDAIGGIRGSATDLGLGVDAQRAGPDGHGFDLDAARSTAALIE